MTTRSDALSEFTAKFRTQGLRIVEFGTWTLSLRPGQLTLGSMVLSLRSGTGDLADVTGDEGRDMAAAFGWAETAARARFGAVRLNILCLMMQDPIVHFHILPRYDRSVDRAGRSWVDADWPGPPTIHPVETEEAVVQAILEELRSSSTATQDN